MADGGGLRLHVLHDGRSIVDVEVESTRPQVFRLLKGKTPEHVIQLAPALFSLCGRAQAAAAEAAVAAARNAGLTRRLALERAVACEAMQEHWWRLLLDWPKVLGLAQLQGDFVRWHGMLRKIAAGQGDMAALKGEIEALWLGMPAVEWLEMENWGDLQRWWQTSASPAASLFAALDVDAMDAQPAKPVDVPLLPNWTAAEAFASCAGKLNADFAACPAWNAAPAETGALAYHAAVPMLRQAMRERPSRVLARVLARAYDTLQMMSGNLAGRLDYAGSQPGAGLAIVRTARGVLLHHVCIVEDLVQDYLVVAPTEWNFHPAGVLAAGLVGLQGDAGQLAQAAERQVLSLDPCVGYEVEMSHA